MPRSIHVHLYISVHLHISKVVDVESFAHTSGHLYRYICICIYNGVHVVDDDDGDDEKDGSDQ